MFLILNELIMEYEERKDFFEGILLRRRSNMFPQTNRLIKRTGGEKRKHRMKLNITLKSRTKIRMESFLARKR
jgi:hypothetical protein